MIEIENKLRSCYADKWCDNCSSDINVLQISVMRKDLKTSQSNSIFLCSQCCEELKIKLAKQLHKGGHNGV